MSFYGQRSCKKDVVEPIEGTVTGEIPTWLKGCLIRNGGGAYEVGQDKYKHVFDGLALMHKFNIVDGSVTYQNRFLHSDSYKKNMAAQRIVVSEFGTTAFPDPCKTLYQRISSIFSPGEMTDNDLIHFTKYADDIYACTETKYIRKIDVKTLETLDKVDLSKYVSVFTATAHTHCSPDGSVYNVGSGSVGGYPTYNILKFPAKENDKDMFQEASIICSIPSKYRFYLSYQHSFGMSENYIIFIEQSYMMSLLAMSTRGITMKSYSDCLHYYPKEKTYFHVVNVKTGERLPTIYTTEAFMFFHQINTYEENDHLILDICCYDNADFVKSLTYDKNTKAIKQFSCHARRFVLPLNIPKSGKVNPEENLIKLEYSQAKAYLQKDGKIMCQYERLVPEEVTTMELPTINYKVYNGKPYQYFYGIGYVASIEERCLIKVDVKNKSILKWNEPNTSPSEAIFVQKPNSIVEDEGVILFSVLYDDNEEKVSLVILDAQNFREVARADFMTGSTITPDFHGLFLEN
ncbi:carotenoid-cleaving dioxygenase, mitochondrial-like [Centruroides vittatus]|uniref:carotenoid-cleaving dioxygenase, mitochondrial-like n=1 Tax=Centruroides vittatus TaxID=120091 RepID=UPI0035103750